ncbi:pilus assembly protein CpaE [Planococcus glaciei]|uniref:AAA family ATPase n=1 Tax=Planococcus glaciei TaxID=459472 RepID=UPI00088C4245|nr:AAA family ATPase [Planococcus glaciei]SDG63978.1 pilus assembly protein CpaE [Planococcus glaciei]
MKPSNLLIVGPKNELLTLLIRQFGNEFEYSWLEPGHLRSELKNIEPSMVLLLHDPGKDLETHAYLQQELSHVPIVFVHESHDFQLFRDLVRAGAVDYFVVPEDLNGLENQISIMLARLQTAPEKEKQLSFKRGTGQVFAFYSGKGGSGKTLLSTAFAQTLKFESTAQVLYIDLNLQYGGGESYLGVETSRNILDLEPVIKEMTEQHLRNVTEKEPLSKMELLISPCDAELAEYITEDFITRLLRVCRRTYDFIIVDLPVNMDERTYTALVEADRIYYTTLLDTPSIRVFKHTEELFQKLGIPTAERLELVLNQVGRENELSKKDIERFIEYPVAAEIRRDMKGVQTAINKGETLRKLPKEKKLTPAAKDMRKWVVSMLK